MSSDKGAVVRYRGTLAVRDHGEAFEILFLDGDDYDWDDPLAERISDDLERHGRYASVRYWTAAAPMGDNEIIEGAVRAMLGDADARYSARYSDVTGYLRTDEDILVGGHDLLEELKSQAGRYCLLEIGYAKEPIGENGRP